MGKRAISELELLNRAEQDHNWLDANYSAIVEKYNDRFVAIKGSAIVASAKTMDDLEKQLKGMRLEPIEVMVQYVTKTTMIF